jgi:hypothetical protein
MRVASQLSQAIGGKQVPPRDQDKIEFAGGDPPGLFVLYVQNWMALKRQPYIERGHRASLPGKSVGEPYVGAPLWLRATDQQDPDVFWGGP